MNSKIDLLLEAEKRGILPEDKAPLLVEARKRGLVPDVEFSAAEMAGNILPSAGAMVNDIYQAVRHPIQTSKSVGNLALGVAQKAIPGEQEKEVYADQVGQFIMDRYGSVNNFKQTVMEDPVGVVADVATIFTGGGTAAAKLPGTAGKIGKLASKTGAAIDPLNVAVNTVKAGGKLVPKKLPRKLYDRSVKWSTVADRKRPGARKRMTETALRESLPGSDVGVGRMHMAIGALEDSLDAAIDASGDAPVDVDALFASLDDTKVKMGGFQMGAADNVAVIDGMVDELRTLVDAKGGNITAADLQKFKVELGQDINWDVSSPGGSRAQNVASKAMRHAAKKSLESVVPEVADINKQLGDLLELKPHLEQAAGRIGNKNPMGIIEPIAIGAGASTAGTPGAVAAGALTAMQRKSTEIAVYLEKLRKQKIPETFIQNNVLPALLREAAVELGRLQQSTNEPNQRKINQNTNTE